MARPKLARDPMFDLGRANPFALLVEVAKLVRSGGLTRSTRN